MGRPRSSCLLTPAIPACAVRYGTKIPAIKHPINRYWAKGGHFLLSAGDLP
jgi:hypothetical protein